MIANNAAFGTILVGGALWGLWLKRHQVDPIGKCGGWGVALLGAWIFAGG